MNTRLADELPIPPHFDLSKAGKVWSVAYEKCAIEALNWAKEYNISPAIEDKTKIALLAIDMQNTFCIPGFELFVAGQNGSAAVDDTIRLCRFIYQNLHRITAILPTLDTHKTVQIFHQIFWVDNKGHHPKPMTVISYDDVKNKLWQVNPNITPSTVFSNPEELQQHALFYVKTLTKAGKYPLIIWPYHAMLGSIGHALTPLLEDALFFHNIARQTQSEFEIKGTNPLTENYSALNAEVLDTFDNKAIAAKNSSLINKLLTCDKLIIAGEAKSHCVAWTIADLLNEIKNIDIELAKKIYILEDCTSSVVVPGVVDFTEAADKAFQEFAQSGINLVKSTDEVSNWP
ncbi:Nicotinamidase [Candidatus Magnetoovum chiemensis]|nr:Nicotinamidase [Candidatus Magnetoovum chiemensis]